MPSNFLRIAKAVASNQVARFAPGFYVRHTGQTGRGESASETSGAIADYFSRCLLDYTEVLGIASADLPDFLRDKVVLEYGPGDIPGVALLLLAYGARKVYCVDRFPLVSIGSKNAEVINRLAASLDPASRDRFWQSFKVAERPEAGFNDERIEYLVRKSGLSGLSEAVDLVLSRAVLEHVNDLEATFRDMRQAMRKGAVSIHQVDLRSHGLHETNPLDFLAPPDWLWQAMHSHKGVPNRWRADRYQQIIDRLGVSTLLFRPTERYSEPDVEAIRSRVAAPFAQVSNEQLSWQGIWLAFRKPD